MEALRRILNIDNLSPLKNLDGTSLDYAHRTCTGIDTDTDAVPFIAEIKPECAGNSDPSVQVSFSYQRHLAQSENDAVRGMTCCPSFLLSLAGPWITIMGAIFRTQVIVQKIGPRHQRIGDTEAAAHPLYALRLALAELKTWYANLRRTTAAPDPVAFPRPHFTSFPIEGATTKFFYTNLINDEPSCAVFLAKLEEDNREVVVKFVDTYGEEGHRWMAEHQLAPNLLYCGKLGDGYEGRSMVVMEKVKGTSLFELYGVSAHDAPSTIEDAVRRALDTLAEGGFIFPDLRTPNVMVVDEDEVTVDQRRVQLVDFDWVCTEGKGERYPCGLSSYVTAASGAEDGVLIQRKHERTMLEYMFAAPEV
ncbi:hypothetical protein BDZ89DRAFT_1072635 [Hymenopellis radicata]|nr:hypothetical protein BDZ89DRAFT_1072635 [Hymenopellis radicata]